MKKIISIITILSFSYLCVDAQEITDGYYRVHSGSGDNYISLVNSKIDDTNKNAIENGGGGNVYSLRLKKIEEAISDPGTIVKVKKEAEGLVLEGQNMDTYKLSSLYLKASNKVAGKNAPTGSYWLYGTKSGATRYIFDSGSGKYDTDLNNEGEKTRYNYIYCVGSQNSGNYTLDSKYSNWYFEAIDNNNTYFGITPEKDIAINGKYYTTVYCSFPFQVTGDMKAYYVTGCIENYGAAKLNEIEDGIVPANTAVIIECTSENPSDNKVIVGVATNKTYANNLIGTYFSYVKKEPGDGKTENTSMSVLKNVITYNSSTMRVLGLSADGKLALVKAKDSKLHVTDKGKYLRANKAHVKVPNAAETIILGDGIDTSISSVQNQEETSDIYNLNGQKMATKGTSIDELPRGLYIINGKKVIKN